MNFKSKKFAWLILGIASLVCSRIVFLFINDPEGPNLLIVVVLAAIIFSSFLLAYICISPMMRVLRRFFAARSILLPVSLTALGIFLFVYGGYDDSPGAQLLGLLVAGTGVVGLFSRKKGSGRDVRS